MIGAAVKVAKIATGKIEEDVDDDGKDKAAVELGQLERDVPAMSHDLRADLDHP